LTDAYTELLEELATQGRAFTPQSAANRHPTYSTYLGAPTVEWQVWESRVLSAVSRRFKEGSSPFELLREAVGLGIEGNPASNFENKRRLLLSAITVSKALIEDQARLGSSEVVSAKKGAAKKPELSGGQNVFIVHGHDNDMKVNVARTIEKLGLVPIILHEKPDKGRTIIEKIQDYSDVGFAIVLLSPDDVGYARDGGEPRSRARQNVVLELGFFLGLLGRSRVLALFKQDSEFEMPTDYSGVLFKAYDAAGGWKMALCGELQAAGLKVDANRIL
jgi:predicted nucleotide-binding protein